MKFCHAVGLALKVAMISGIMTNSASRSGQAARPASVIRPSRSSRRQRSLLSSVHIPFLLRGPKRWSVTSPTVFTVESIHPKHSASSTASRYYRASSGGVLPRFAYTQHSFSVALFAASHLRKSARFVMLRMFLGVISTDVVAFHLNTFPSLAETLVTFFFWFVNLFKSGGFITPDGGWIVIKDSKRYFRGSKRIESIPDGHSYKSFAQAMSPPRIIDNH